MIDGLEDQWAELEYLALHQDDDKGFCSGPGAKLLSCKAQARYKKAKAEFERAANMGI